MQFSLVFKKLCKQKGVTQQQALNDMVLGRNAVQSWDKGKPRPETLQKISKYFSISVDDLLATLDSGTEDNKKTAIQTDDGNENEKEFINLFLQLSPEEQLRELSYLRDVVNRKGI